MNSIKGEGKTEGGASMYFRVIRYYGSIFPLKKRYCENSECDI